MRNTLLPLLTLVLIFLVTIPASSQVQIDSIVTTDETCPGANDGTITVYASNGTTPYDYSIGGAPQSSNVFTGVACGSYTVIVTDAIPTTAVGSATINCATPVTSTFFVIEPSCTGMCNGEIILTTTGGTPPYVVNDPLGGPPISYTGTAIIPGLCAGSYTLVVEDALGCQEFLIVTVIDPPLLTVTASATGETSPGACDGTITATATGGTPTYNYQYIECSTGTPVTGPNFCAGDYAVVVTDVNGCVDTSACVTVGSGCSMVNSVMTVDAICNGFCDGEIIITSTGGTPPYTVNDPITGLPVTYTSNHGFSGLCSGSYTLIIEDAAGCSETYNLIILEPTEVLHTTSITNESSPGACDGSITVTATGGTPGYMYSINCGGSFQLSPVFGGLCAGTYGVTVIDANGCLSYCESAGDTVSFGGPPCTMVSTTMVTNTSCAGTCDGEILLLTTGGTPPYVVYDPVGGLPITYTSSHNFTGLCLGSYTLLIEDAAGCSEVLVVAVLEPSPLTQTFTSADESSPGACDGSITVTGAGGTPGYLYSIDCGLTFQTGPFTGLCAGVYSVMTTDVNGCVTTCDSVTIGSVGCTMVSTTSVTNATCAGTCDGTVIVFTTGGTPPYTVNDPMGGPSISYSSAGTIPNLCAGTYTLQIEDAAGCIEFLVVTVTEPPAITQTVSVTNESSPGACDGTATITSTGGTGAFQFSLDCGVTYQGSNTFTGLCAGTYGAMTMDANGCTSSCDSVVIDTDGCSMVNSVMTVDATCNGFCDGEIIITSTGGTPPYTVNDPITGLPVTYTSTHVFSGLCSGNYTLIIEDAVGCSETYNLIILEPTEVLHTTSITNESSPGACDGSITVTATGGTPGYMYSINCGGSFQLSPVFGGLCAGTYGVTVMDANGCLSYCESEGDTVSSGGTPCTMVSTTAVTNVACFGFCDGEIHLLTTGGTPPYIVYDPLSGTPLTYTSSITLPGFCPGTYTLLIEDAGGCSETLVEVITEPAEIISTVTFTDPTFTGACDGTATAATSGGTPPYIFDWIDCATGVSIGQPVPGASGLCAGSYAIVVTDANGCTDTSACVTLVDPPLSVSESEITVGLDVYPNPSNGVINIRVTGVRNNGGTIELTDVLGNLIDKRSITDNTPLRLDLASEGLQSGVYLLSYKYELHYEVIKVVYGK